MNFAKEHVIIDQILLQLLNAWLCSIARIYRNVYKQLLYLFQYLFASFRGRMASFYIYDWLEDGITFMRMFALNLRISSLAILLLIYFINFGLRFNMMILSWPKTTILFQVIRFVGCVNWNFSYHPLFELVLNFISVINVRLHLSFYSWLNNHFTLF